jgi:hypothetical protein
MFRRLKACPALSISSGSVILADSEVESGIVHLGGGEILIGDIVRVGLGIGIHTIEDTHRNNT